MNGKAEMSENGHERWHEEVAAYVLGALDPERVAALERHAGGCERCQAQVRWLMPAVDALPESVPRAEPPPELRSRLMAEVRADARQRCDTAATAGPLHRVRAARGLGCEPAAGGRLRRRAARCGRRRRLRDRASADSDGGYTPHGRRRPRPGGYRQGGPDGDWGTLHLTNVQQLPDERSSRPGFNATAMSTRSRPSSCLTAKVRASTTIADMQGVEVVMVTTEPRGGSVRRPRRRSSRVAIPPIDGAAA